MSTHEAGSALVTGAAGGIGEAICHRLAASGRPLILIDQDEALLEQVCTRVRNRSAASVQPVVVDLADPEAIERIMQPVATATPVGILVNNAGTAIAADILATKRGDWERIFAVNVQAIYELSRLIVPGMIKREGGVIINIASAAGLVGLRSRAAYCASKGAVIALTRAMAVDHAGANIRVTAVCPGTIGTGWIDQIVRDAADPQAARTLMAQRQLVGRLGTPDEVADAVMFSIENTFMTGGVLVVDGGMTAT